MRPKHILAAVLIVALVPVFSGVSHASGPRAVQAVAVAAATPTPATTVPLDVAILHPTIVITDIGGTFVATSTRVNRLIEVGTDLNGPQQYNIPHGTFAVVDTKSNRVEARQVTPGSIDVAAIDEARSLGYVTMAYYVPIGSYMRSFRLALWQIDLHSGRIRSRTLFYEGEHVTVVNMTVDPVSGHVIVTANHDANETNDLFVVDPVAQVAHLEALEGVPVTLYVDAANHRAVIGLQLHAPTPGETVFAGFDTRTGLRAWTHIFVYGIQDNALAFNTRTHQLWYEAPGGLITVLSAATGATSRVIQMGYSDPNGLGTQQGFAIDTMRNTGYLRWSRAGNCTIDAASAAGGSRHSIYQGSNPSCLNAYSDATAATSVNPANGVIVVAGQSGTSLFSDGGSLLHQYVVSDQSGIGSAQQSAPVTVLQDGAHTTIVLPRTVPHQNQVSGAATTGAVVFVPVQ